MFKIEDLINRKKRIQKAKIYPARDMVVMEDCTLGDVLEKMDYDRFHILTILNGSFEVVGQITEQQIITAVQACNIQDRICDVFFLGP